MNVVAHNLTAINTQRQYGLNADGKAKSTEKLASGYRINRAADDAAGLSISEKMRRQIRGLNQASQNASDGISLVQTADGAMHEITDMIQRVNELSVQAANGTYTDVERGYIQDEIDLLTEEIERVTEHTVFNERPVLKGEGDGTMVTITIPQGNSLPSWIAMDGPSATDGIMASSYTDPNDNTKTYAASYLDFSHLTTDPTKVAELDGAGFHFTCCTCDRYYSVEFDASTTTSSIDTPTNNCYIYKVGIQGLTTANDILTAVYNALGGGNPQNHFTQMVVDGDKAIFHDNRVGTFPDKSSGRGVFDQQTVHSTKTAATNYAVTLQIGGESGETLKIDMPNMTTLKTASWDVTTPEKARQTLEVVKGDLNHVSTERSRMGAYQNRLEHTIANLDNVSENTQAAESRIRDLDMAKEMVKLSNHNILQRAGQAMMAQANKSNQGVLSLLS